MELNSAFEVVKWDIAAQLEFEIQ